MVVDLNKNIRINSTENSVSVEIDTAVYSLDIIYSACYVFLDRAYILIDSNNKKIEIEMVPKKGADLKGIGPEFNNELLNYAYYKMMSRKNSDLRKIILQRALITNDPSVIDLDVDDFELEDKKNIKTPWNENAKKKK